MQANRNKHLCQEKSPNYKLSRSKAPKTLQAARKTIEPFSLYDTGVDFSSSNIFCKLRFLRKSFRFCRMYNSLELYIAKPVVVNRETLLTIRKINLRGFRLLYRII